MCPLNKVLGSRSSQDLGTSLHSPRSWVLSIASRVLDSINRVLSCGSLQDLGSWILSVESWVLKGFMALKGSWVQRPHRVIIFRSAFSKLIIKSGNIITRLFLYWHKISWKSALKSKEQCSGKIQTTVKTSKMEPFAKNVNSGKSLTIFTISSVLIFNWIFNWILNTILGRANNKDNNRFH